MAVIAEFLNFWSRHCGWKTLICCIFRVETSFSNFSGVDRASITGPEENSFALPIILILDENKTVSQGYRNCIFCYLVHKNKARRISSGI